MTQKLSPKAAAKCRRRSRSRTWAWVLVSVFLVLLLIGAGISGYQSDSEIRAAIETQRAENRQQEELRLALAAEGDERDARLAAIDGEIAGKDAQLEAIRGELADKDARIGDLNAELADKDARIQAGIDDSAGKDSEILSRRDESADRDERIEALEAEIAEAQTLVAEEPASAPAVSEPSASPEDGPQPDAWGYVDEDGDGLILVPIKGKFTGYMLIVLDPSRVVLSCEPKMLGAYGYDVQHYVEKEDGVAGINGGSFADEGGRGNGSLPDTMIFSHGEAYCSGQGMGYYFTGIDDENVLHVGVATAEEAQALHIRDGCCFRPGPILVKDGQLGPEDRLWSGLNPRTAIGQRSDGAILLLVVEGRQPSRIGCSFLDEAELMLRFGAVNACNMDGGSSTMMWYGGEYINNRANVINVRPIPTSWVVLKEGRDGNG